MARTPQQLAADFTEAMKGIHAQAANLKPPFHAPEFIRMVHEHGGKETADRLLASGDVSRGFTRLWERTGDGSLLTLSMEYLVLQDPWRSLFTDQQHQIARTRLTTYGGALPPCDALWQRLTTFLQQLNAEVDQRNQPDAARLGAFRRGWSDGLKDDVQYTGDALQRLTWQNLGYRFAKNFGDMPAATVEAVFDHLSARWHRPEPAPDLSPTADPVEFEQRVNAILAHSPGRRPPPPGCAKPERIRLPNAPEAFKRDPDIAAWVKAEAAGRCELCRQPAPFTDADGKPFLEVHHVVRLADNGPDQAHNAVALCPNCHRRCHHAQDRAHATRALYELVARLRAPESVG